MPRTSSIIPRPPAAFLRALYIDQQLGCPDIGRLFERDAKTVLYWLRQAGIQTRPRGSDQRQHFRKGGDPRSFAGTKHSAETRLKIAASSAGRKPYLRDGQHWLRTVPADQNPNWKGGCTPERQEFYRTAEWKAACRAVWRRANACCERCDLDWRTVDRETEPTFHVHHIVSFQVKALRAVVSNLVLLCRPCHLWVHSNANAGREFLAPAESSLADFEALEREAA